MVKSPASCPVRLQRVMVAPVSSGSAAVYEARTRSVAWFSVNERLCCPDISGPSFWSVTVTVTSSVPELNASSMATTVTS